MEGKDFTQQGITERARAGIAYSFQHPARFKGATFRDLLSIAAGTEDEDAMAKIVARVGICSLDCLDKPVDSRLSGGEIKKVELTHEASIGKIADEQLMKLMSLGLTYDEAVNRIMQGFLK